MEADRGERQERLTRLIETWREFLIAGTNVSDVRRVGSGLVNLIARELQQDGSSEDRLRERLESLVDRGELGTTWDAVEKLHLGLDMAVKEGAIPPGDAIRLRRGLTALQSRLHRVGLSARLAARRELLRDITHDLRVPLNSIVFLTDSLFDERHGQLSEPQRRKLGGVYSASTTLLNFVNDLLDLSQSTEEDFECSCIPFSIRGVVEDLRHLVRPVADYHGANLEIDLQTEDSWEGDPRLVRRILLNLVTNALEAAGEGGEVRVALEEIDGDEPGMRRLVVSDTGPGIDLERAEALLDPVDEPGWKKLLDGTDGLGLLIIGRLVRAAGGSVSVEHGGDSGGTRFAAELPFGESA